MTLAPSILRSVSRRALVWRLFWFGMLAAHAPALAPGLLRPSPEPARVLLLLAAQVFFLLKLLDVPWLRIAPCRRTRRALIAGFVLLHAQVIDRNVAHDLDSPVSWHMVVLGGGLTALALSIRCEPRALDSAGRHRAGAPLRLGAHTRPADELAPRLLIRLRTCLLNRAPPAVSLY